MRPRPSLVALTASVQGLIFVSPMPAMPTARSQVVPLSSLNVPRERLPPGCSLATRVFAVSAKAVNPWSGTDPIAIAEIRERVDGPTLIPDGPPLGLTELARFRLYLAEGVEEGYAAVYEVAEPGKEVVVVYGLRFANVESAGRRSDHHQNPKNIRVEIGPTVAVVHGDGSRCFQAIGEYVKSLTK